MLFRSVKRSFYIIIACVTLQVLLLVMDQYFYFSHRQIIDRQQQFSRVEHRLLAVLELEKEAQHDLAYKEEVFERYQHIIAENGTADLGLDQHLLEERCATLTDLLDLQAKKSELHARLNTTLPALATSMSSIHKHHISYLREMVKNDATKTGQLAPASFGGEYAMAVAELDIIAAAIDIQHAMMEVVELFSRLQAGASPALVHNAFQQSISRFYIATTRFEDLSLDAQDGLLVEALLIDGGSFERIFEKFLLIEERIRNALQAQENNRLAFLDNLASSKAEHQQRLAAFTRKVEVNKSVSFAINLAVLIILFLITRKMFGALKKVAVETRKIELNHGYRIPLQCTDFKEFASIFQALNLMGEAVSRKFDHLADSHAMLETEVVRRTAELSQTNIRLSAEIEEGKKKEIERRELEERLKRAEKMEAIGTLAGGVAHDLNNILSGVVSYPELLLMDLPPDHKFRKPLQIIMESGEKASAIVEDLLAMARRGVAKYTQVSLNALVEEFCQSHEMNSIQVRHPGVELHHSLRAKMDTIAGSKVHLLKMLMNLVTNAAESIEHTGTISVSSSNAYIDTVFRGYDQVRQGEYVQLSVKDTGIGIAEKDVERIFEPFFTTKRMGRSGSGLGMAVVWGTVKDHNGYINVTSERGKGTTFDLYFPLMRVTREKRSVPEGPTPLQTGKGEMVLVVDDIAQQRDIATIMLKRLGYSVEAVSSGEEALKYVERNRVDILLLDMIMPDGMDGLETYRKICTLSPQQKAVIASGFSDNEKVREAQRLGAGTYVKKPYSLAELSRALREELDR